MQEKRSREHMKRNILFVLQLSFLFCLPVHLQPGYGQALLTENQVQAIRQELDGMKEELNLLRTQSILLQEDSQEWQNKCNMLGQRLTKASQGLESSTHSVVELQEQVGSLRNQLDGLKTEFSELNQSYLKQKEKTSFWRGAAVISTLVAVIEGSIIWLSR